MNLSNNFFYISGCPGCTTCSTNFIIYLGSILTLDFLNLCPTLLNLILEHVPCFLIKENLTSIPSLSVKLPELKQSFSHSDSLTTIYPFLLMGPGKPVLLLK